MASADDENKHTTVVVYMKKLFYGVLQQLCLYQNVGKKIIIIAFWSSLLRTVQTKQSFVDFQISRIYKSVC